MSSPEETPIIEEQRRLSQNGVLNTGFIHTQPPQYTPSNSSPLQQTLQLLQQQLAQQQQQMAQQQQLLSQLVQQQQQQQQPPTPSAICAKTEQPRRMKAIARSYLYWPMIDDDIMSYVASCGSCLAAAKAPPRATPATWPTPSGAWRRVHVDYAEPLEGYYFLVVVDAFSKWPEIYKTTSTTTSATISMLRNIFARFGMPETLVSDNGPQFTSALFAEFCNSSGIEHITTAPFHLQSNGQAERFVDTLKRALRKIQSDETSLDEALELFLMTYRSTPNAQLSQQKYPTEKRNSWKWIPGKIVRSCGRVMYDVIANDGRLLRRHINQIRRRAVARAPEGHQLPLDVLLEEWSSSSSRPEPTQSELEPIPTSTTVTEVGPTST
ncbi:uncharacterized protein K02A2.6-like [Anopheles arabiensis]|uniref:uncharacterized protein K02A2.6-like n=1 Tax=Anopheles arabiensis TaxID=7173 RepID=UPI001AADA60E|nr:uncharacterized protein K02A2.6-like [Anopheles arabiensis]